MNNQVELKVVYDNKYDYYDIDAICRNADSIYWTLVPNEVAHRVFDYNAYASINYVWE